MKNYLHSVLAVVDKRAIVKGDFAKQKAVRSKANNQFKQSAECGFTSSSCHDFI